MTIIDKITRAQTAHGIAPSEASTPFNSFSDALKFHSENSSPFITYYNEINQSATLSYSDFVSAVRKTASLLAERGVGTGSVVAVAAYNHPETVIQYFASWMLGAMVAPLNMSEDDNRIAFILENSNAVLLFVRQEFLERLRPLTPITVEHVIVCSEDNCDGTFRQLLSAEIEHPFHDQNHLSEPALLVYTSGTTGNPKGVVLDQLALFADCFEIARWHGIDSSQTMMCVLPIHHVNGAVVTHVTPFLVGARVVLNRKFQTEFFFERIKIEAVNIVSVVPTLLAFLLDAKADSLGVEQTSLRHIICGAGPLTCELAQRFEGYYSIPILHGYGLSETTCYSCFLPTDLTDAEHLHWMQDYGFPSIGVPIQCNEMAIHNDHGESLGEMKRGEIVIRGSNVMQGYFKNDSANESAFEFGWFRSGDEGFFKCDDLGRHFFFITGRIKELIIRGGVNLAPLEIDEVLAQAPGVKAGICVGFTNNFYGEEVGAFVVRLNEFATEESILEFCRANLPFSKAPKVVVFTESLPVTSTGKYQRNKVKHLFSEWQDVQFKKR